MHLPCVAYDLPRSGIVPNNVTLEFVTFIIDVDEDYSIFTIQLISTKTCTHEEIVMIILVM